MWSKALEAFIEHMKTKEFWRLYLSKIPFKANIIYACMCHVDI